MLRLPLVGADARAPAHLIERHLRRRQLDELAPARGDGDPGSRAALAAHLRGNLRLGYFSTILGFGTPAQHFDLIVDTGSGITAVPCAGCTQCGSHRKFDARLSTTARTCAGSGCAFSIGYQEGSAYRGQYVNDTISIGSASACAALSYRFGCSSVETGLFRSQEADGIMGLAPGTARRRTVQDALVARRIVRDVFSLCVAHQTSSGHGFLEFGESARARGAASHAQSATTPIVRSNAYIVTVSAVRLGASAPSLGVPENVLLDSGTTYVYVGSRIFSPLFRAVSAVSLGGCALAARAPPRAGEICVGPADAHAAPAMPARLDRCFAELVFTLPGGSLAAPPSSYWYEEGKGGARRGVWCMGVFKNHNQQLVLGASVLQDVLVTVDRERKLVRFTPHRCDEPPPSNLSRGMAVRGPAAGCVPPPEVLARPRATPGLKTWPLPARGADASSPPTLSLGSGDASAARPRASAGWLGGLQRLGGRWWPLYTALTAVCSFLLCSACLVLGCAREGFDDMLSDAEAVAWSSRAGATTGGVGTRACGPGARSPAELALGRRAPRAQRRGEPWSQAPAQTADQLEADGCDALREGQLPVPDGGFATVTAAPPGGEHDSERQSLLAAS